ADPFEYQLVPADGSDGVAQMESRLRCWQAIARPDLPPFQGGAAGVLFFDLGRSLERIPQPRYDEFQLPALAIGFYDTVLAIDHAEHRAWLISQGFPEAEPSRRLARARQRIDRFRELLAAPAQRDGLWKSPTANELGVLAASDLAPLFP